MITNELLKYINAEFRKGISKDDIKQRLISGGGWSESDINSAFNKIDKLKSNHGYLFAFVVICILSILGVSILLNKDKSNKLITKNNEQTVIDNKSGTEPMADQKLSDGAIDCGKFDYNNDLHFETFDKFYNYYKNDNALKCFGEKAQSCKDAKLELDFETFNIQNENGKCFFNLTNNYNNSYNKCPLNIVRKSNSRFRSKQPIRDWSDLKNPELLDTSNYALRILFYSVEMVYDITNIEEARQLGCEGNYISNSIIQLRKEQKTKVNDLNSFILKFFKNKGDLYLQRSTHGYNDICNDSEFKIGMENAFLGEGLHDYFCKDGVSGYSVYAPLTYGGYCIDSTGFNGEVDQYKNDISCE